MKITQERECVRCDRILDENRAACPKCGTWQPWGDRAVVAARNIRLRKFVLDEQKAERHFLELRHAPEARAQREPLTYRLRRELYLAKFSPARAIGAAVALTFALTLTGSWVVFGGGQKTGYQPSRNVSAREIGVQPTARCQDGSDWFGTSRRGACSGHGGVAQFFIPKDE